MKCKAVCLAKEDYALGGESIGKLVAKGSPGFIAANIKASACGDALSKYVPIIDGIVLISVIGCGNEIGRGCSNSSPYQHVVKTISELANSDKAVVIARDIDYRSVELISSIDRVLAVLLIDCDPNGSNKAIILPLGRDTMLSLDMCISDKLLQYKMHTDVIDRSVVPDQVIMDYIIDTERTIYSSVWGDARTIATDGMSKVPALSVSGLNAADASATGYAGSKACSACHLLEYRKWLVTEHAENTKKVLKHSSIDAGCLPCHVTGWERGFANQAATAAGMEAVGCESCHGPGSKHIASSTKRYIDVDRNNEYTTKCIVCHNHAHSPGFDPESAWMLVAH